MLRRDIPRPVAIALTVLSFVLTLSWYVWKSQSVVGDVEQSTFFPTVAEIIEGGREIFTDPDGKIWIDIGASVRRVFLGFLLAAIVAIPLGIYIGAYRVCEALIQPVVEFVRYLPVPALIPLLIAIYGVDEEPKVILIFIGTFFQLVLMVGDEIRRVPNDLVRAAYTLGATPFEALTKVLFRKAMPGIFDALRLCHGWAWTYVVVAELIATNEGLGIRIMKFGRFIQMPKVMCYLLVLGLIGLALDLLFRYFNRRLFRWAEAVPR